MRDPQISQIAQMKKKQARSDFLKICVIREICG